MSPEQVRGDDVDARSDLFAFGALLYEMLSGEPAFRRETGVETLHAVLKEPAPRLPGDGARRRGPRPAARARPLPREGARPTATPRPPTWPGRPARGAPPARPARHAARAPRRRRPRP